MSFDLPLEILPHEASMILTQQPITILDVREEWERAIVTLQESLWIPLGTLLASSPSQLAPLREGVFTLCHHGVRSLKAALYLRAQNINACSIKGGIDGWATEIETTLARY